VASLDQQLRETGNTSSQKRNKPKGMTNKIVKYNLLQKKWEKEITLPDAGVHNKYPYQSGKFTDIDFAIDEKGLWVILATTYSNGNIVILKFDDEMLEITR
jgi:hypothetical protein